MTTPTDAARGAWDAAGYALVTLLAAAAALAIMGDADADRIWGVASAWTVQALAFWRLDRALGRRTDARGVWIAGILARGGGLLLTAALALGGAATANLPIAYGLAMVILLLVEAGWLALRPQPRTTGPAGTGDVNEIDGTHSTG